MNVNRLLLPNAIPSARFVAPEAPDWLANPSAPNDGRTGNSVPHCQSHCIAKSAHPRAPQNTRPADPAAATLDLHGTRRSSPAPILAGWLGAPRRFLDPKQLAEFSPVGVPATERLTSRVCSTSKLFFPIQQRQTHATFREATQLPPCIAKDHPAQTKLIQQSMNQFLARIRFPGSQ